MSADSSSLFLRVRPGDLVVVEEGPLVMGGSQADWWLGHVMHVVGGARSSRVNSLFQVADVDTGLIKIINADVVKGILRPKDLAS